MLTAIAVLIVSAVGGGVVGAFLTTQYPASAICGNCQERAVSQQYQMDSYYQRELDAHIREQNKIEEDNQPEMPIMEEFPEEDYVEPQNGNYEEYDPNAKYYDEEEVFYPEGDYPAESEEDYNY
ncbi:hypothetical protein ThvES_00013300 [Thiovulum sp. ES]|nr:hypothetical protein ThvES_00013300 [Thiovulum sp. ES]